MYTILFPTDLLNESMQELTWKSPNPYPMIKRFLLVARLLMKFA